MLVTFNMDEYSTFKHLNYISYIYGIFSFDGYHPSFKSSLNVLKMCCKILFPLMICILYAQMFYTNSRSLSNVFNISYNILYLTLICSYIITMVRCLFSQSRVTSIIYKMLRLEILIQKDYFNSTHPKRVCYINLVAGNILLMASYSQYIYECRFKMMILFFTESTLHLVQVHFMFLVLLLREHLNFINRQLEHSVVKWEEVVVWSQHRAGIVGVARLVNAAYSVQVLTGVSSVFIILSTFTFYLTALFSGYDHTDYKTVEFYLYLLSYMSYYPFMLWSYLYPCESTMSEANDTALKVHAVIRRTNDESLRNKLKQFSLQLLDSKIQFTACGFFPLDYTLLHSIIAASTMYFIILVQFQMSTKPTQEDQHELDTIQCLNYLNKINTSYALN